MNKLNLDNLTSFQLFDPKKKIIDSTDEDEGSDE